MTTVRHILIALVAVAASCGLTALATPATVWASTAPQLGPLNPAFVEALHDPQVALGLGRLPSPVEVSVSRKAGARAARAMLPARYSLVEAGLVTRPVKDQGADATCWAFANVAALESAILKRQGRSTDLSENDLVRRSGFWSTRTQRYAWGGYDFMAVAYFARWAGPVRETDDPYGRYRAPTPKRGKTVRHVQGVVMIPGRRSSLDNDLIKGLVMENGALSVGMCWDDAAFDTAVDDEGTHSTHYLPEEREENHGVAVVGWDDAYPAERFQGMYGPPPAPGAFLVRNSWGADWGSDGYLWVSYYDAAFARDMGLGTWGGCTSYAAVADIGDYSRNYGHDKLGVTGRVGYPDGGPVWAANRFTAASRRPIRAVGFYTLSSDTPYEVWAGRGLKQLTRRAKGVSALPGYTTVRLRTPLKVVKGRTFVVAIRLASPDGSYPLAVERGRRIPLGNSRVVFAATGASRGQSYVGAKRWRLKDLTLSLPRTNVCLKAFAD